MLLLTAIVGLVVWAVSDTIQTNRLRNIFYDKLVERFSLQAEKQRIMFDRYVKGHHQAVKLFIESHNIKQYVAQAAWDDGQKLVVHKETPAWLPRLSVIRNFFQPGYLMLLGADGHVKEVYQARRESPPAALMKPDGMLLRLSNNQGFLTTIEGKPYLLASAKVDDDNGKVRATLLVAAPLDEQFLIASQRSSLSGNSVIALLTEGQPAILVSSNSLLVPPGTRIDELKDRYLTIGQGFFDYGATDIVIELVSFVSTEEVRQLTHEVLSEDRMMRGLTAFAFIVAFVVLMYFITRRIQRFTSYVVEFYNNMNIEQPEQSGKGDEIAILEQRFHSLAEAVESETLALEHQALHDPLTELPNRKLLHNRLQQEILRGERTNRPLVLIMSDLNHFKEINDTLGHHIGDLVLQQAAVRLHNIFRKTDSVARLGGDEFGILLPETNLEQAIKLASKVVEDFSRSFIVEGHTLSVGISMGLVECPLQGNDVNILVQRADVAMYVAKRNNLGYTVYDPNKDTHSIGRLALMSEFREAIQKQMLDLYYQPKIELSSGKVVGAEALLRWHHPERGFIGASEFIPLAEQTGLIKPLTKWVLHQAVRQCMEWRRHVPDFTIAVNLSVHNLHDAKLLDQIGELITEYRMPPESLTLEITEGDIMADPIRGRELLEQLDAMGIVLSIDDFGTGYSSLGYLKQLPVAEIKIDRSFVIEMTEDENDAVIVRATVDLAHNLGMRIVAEGVKDRKTWEFLRSLNCDVAQGYYISKAIPSQKFTDWLLSQEWVAREAAN
jgi:diguanylate cyclase (GGDEF)-like protein